MIKWLEQAPSTGSTSTTDLSSNIVLEPESEASTSKQIDQPSFSSTAHTPLPIIPEEILIPPTTIRGRYPELFNMHDKGRSVEQIAKALGMNKGEVQLILQLVRREEEYHA